jgi:hypothetical protein
MNNRDQADMFSVIGEVLHQFGSFGLGWVNYGMNLIGCVYLCSDWWLW